MDKQELNHIAQTRKKVLSPKQIKTLAEMYAEKNDVPIFNMYPKAEIARFGAKDGRAFDEVHFNDLNIVMGVLKWWVNVKNYRGAQIDIDSDGYMVELDSDMFDADSTIVEHHSPSLIITIAEALTKIKEKL